MFRLIKAERTKGNDISLWGKDEYGRKLYFEVPFRPFFYIKADESLEDAAVTECEWGHISAFGEELQRVYVSNPSEVPRLRERVRTWESDIPYGRRYLITKGITSGFNENLEPAMPPDVPIKTLYIDCEMKASDQLPNPLKDPITCFCIGDGQQFISVILDNLHYTEKKDDWVIFHVTNERKLLKWVDVLLWVLEPDVLTGWNVEFDVDYLRDRMKVNRMSLSLGGICQFDALSAYRGLYRRKSYRLKDIAMDEGFATELEEKVNYQEMWEKDKPGLLARNLRHTKWVSQIDQKLHIVDYFWTLKETAGLEDLEDTQHNSVIIDAMLLRRTPGALPAKEKREHEVYEGAHVMQPPIGVFSDVAVFDLKRFYPSIFLSERLDPIILHQFLEQNKELDWNKYREFASQYTGPTLALGLISEMIAERDKLQALGHKDKLAAVKAVLNSVYGIFAAPYFRMYVREIPERITEVARNVIVSLGKELESWGIRVVYQDTDSAHCLIGNQDPKEIETKLNEALKKHGDYSIKLEHFFPKMAFIGKKKKYCGLLESGDLKIVGFEWIRSDSSNYTKEIQERVLRMILQGEKDALVSYLREKIDGIKKASLLDIAVSKTLSRELDGYSGPQVNYIKALKLKQKGEINQGDAVKIIPALDQPYGVLVFQDLIDLPKKFTIDWEAVIEKQIKAKVEDLLPLCDLSWEVIEGQGRLF